MSIYFRDIDRECEIPISRNIGSQLKLVCPVSTLACSPTSEVRFGVLTSKIQEFKKNLCRYEVEGRRVRSFYRIEWKDAHPLAENYLWTILSNKVISLVFSQKMKHYFVNNSGLFL